MFRFSMYLILEMTENLQKAYWQEWEGKPSRPGCSSDAYL